MMRFNDYAQALARGDIGAADAISRRSIPDTLLKFVALDGSDGDEARFGSLERSEIWLSNGLFFNDPFDLKAMALDHDRLRGFGCTEDDIVRLQQMVDFGDYGVCCLTANSLDDFHMWEEYASKGKGFCIEYKVLHKLDIWEALYEDGGIDASWLVWKLDDALRSRGKRASADFEVRSYAGILLQGLWMKTSAWSHEREFRVVRDIGGKAGESLQAAEVGLIAKRIVAGASCLPQDVERLSSISRELGLGSICVREYAEPPTCNVAVGRGGRIWA